MLFSFSSYNSKIFFLIQYTHWPRRITYQDDQKISREDMQQNVVFVCCLQHTTHAGKLFMFYFCCFLQFIQVCLALPKNKQDKYLSLLSVLNASVVVRPFHRISLPVAFAEVKDRFTVLYMIGGYKGNLCAKSTVQSHPMWANEQCWKNQTVSHCCDFDLHFSFFFFFFVCEHVHWAVGTLCDTCWPQLSRKDASDDCYSCTLSYC